MGLTIAVIGLGLMGGSLSIALRNWEKTTLVRGFDRDDDVLSWAEDHHCIDVTARSLPEAVQGAELVFIATPVRTIPAIFSSICSYLRPGAVIFDLGSTREWIFEHIHFIPNHISYGGFHLMGGSEKEGIRNARCDMFSGIPILVSPSSAWREEAESLVQNIGRYLGGRVFFCPHPSMI
ncbi:MAG: prephenate dehydrogenase/arogenate dehydrogenase family protein [Candidatus Atribacteria bacterium]|nr:prephenate dehydrogenase/arogenate dehydrogenase family protein [Candidatus Atribacteria bacterium]